MNKNERQIYLDIHRISKALDKIVKILEKNNK